MYMVLLSGIILKQSVNYHEMVCSLVTSFHDFALNLEDK